MTTAAQLAAHYARIYSTERLQVVEKLVIESLRLQRAHCTTGELAKSVIAADEAELAAVRAALKLKTL